MKHYSSALCLLLSVHLASAQNILYGTVTDSLTSKPIAHATVFFANTSLGTTADENGKFKIENFSSGKYKLVVSSMGYKLKETPLVFLKQPRNIEISLRPKPVKLDNVVINSEIYQNPLDLNRFKKHFIGETRNASSCRIVNERRIALYYKQKKVFVATAKDPLEIINRALGYKLIFDLESFEVDFNKSTLYYEGIPRFEKLTPKNEHQQKIWERERLRAYEGSFMHLVRNLRNGVIDSSFVIYELYKVPNRKRPSDEYLEKKIRYWRGQFYGNKGLVRVSPGLSSRQEFDSLNKYFLWKQEPKIIDSVGQIYTKAEQLLDASREHLVYNGTGIIYIIFKGEKRDPGYGWQKLKGDTSRFEQHSIVEFRRQKIAIYDNGYYDAGGLFFAGYMAWSEKIAELLPLDYIARKDED